jgi:hypothetical protein
MQLRHEVERLEQRLASVEAKLSQPAPAPPPAVLSSWTQGLHLSGYLQLQYGRSDLSEDQIQQGGASLNQDAFVVRRARLRVRGEWDFSGFLLEIDGNTVNGASVGLRRAEAFLFWRSADAKSDRPASDFDAFKEAPPYIKATAGLTRIPFGHEVPEPENELLFMERTTASLAFFPGPQDVGLVVSGGVGPLRYALGVMGGYPSASGVSIPLTAQPTWVGRLGAARPGRDSFEISGGVSFLDGTGLSPGTDATKATLQWQDLNENGVVDTGEVVGIPGASARPSETFSRWAVDADFEVGFRTKAGWTRLATEAALASNLDRGLFVADPVFLGRDLRETSFFVSLEQDITRFAFVGVRADLYNPDSDFLTSDRGQPMVTDQTITTISPHAGLVLPGRGRLVFQYNFVNNAEGLALNGVPTSLDSNNWTVRLQAEF